MELIDYLIIAIVVAILGFAVWYIRRAKKKGAKCIGCPDGGSCSGQCAGCACGCDKSDE